MISDYNSISISFDLWFELRLKQFRSYHSISLWAKPQCLVIIPSSIKCNTSKRSSLINRMRNCNFVSFCVFDGFNWRESCGALRKWPMHRWRVCRRPLLPDYQSPINFTHSRIPHYGLTSTTMAIIYVLWVEKSIQFDTHACQRDVEILCWVFKLNGRIVYSLTRSRTCWASTTNKQTADKCVDLIKSNQNASRHFPFDIMQCVQLVSCAIYLIFRCHDLFIVFLQFASRINFSLSFAVRVWGCVCAVFFFVLTAFKT